MASSFPVSFGSDLSGLDEEIDVQIQSRELYTMVENERKKLQDATGKKKFKWSVLKTELAKCHPYFAIRTVNQIRDRYKYIKKELKHDK